MLAGNMIGSMGGPATPRANLSAHLLNNLLVFL
jgi:hypothetical protein